MEFLTNDFLTNAALTNKFLTNGKTSITQAWGLYYMKENLWDVDNLTDYWAVSVSGVRSATISLQTVLKAKMMELIKLMSSNFTAIVSKIWYIWYSFIATLI
jgi:hypothetical protein